MPVQVQAGGSWQAAHLDVRAGGVGRLHVPWSQRGTKSMAVLPQLCRLLLEAA